MSFSHGRFKLAYVNTRQGPTSGITFDMDDAQPSTTYQRLYHGTHLPSIGLPQINAVQAAKGTTRSYIRITQAGRNNTATGARSTQTGNKDDVAVIDSPPRRRPRTNGAKTAAENDATTTNSVALFRAPSEQTKPSTRKKPARFHSLGDIGAEENASTDKGQKRKRSVITSVAEEEDEPDVKPKVVRPRTGGPSMEGNAPGDRVRKRTEQKYLVQAMSLIDQDIRSGVDAEGGITRAGRAYKAMVRQMSEFGWRGRS
ncbi:hypothetical protein LTR66_016452 [Elasticomyces elasticus]|nr:hypothetical protein LTR66_016452 [Elasticomyces elasticus]